MPLTAFRRGNRWWVKGTVDLAGEPVTGYIRRSTGALTEAGARAWIAETEKRTRRRHLLAQDEGLTPEQRTGLTFDEAVTRYPAKPAEARYLIAILPHLTGRLVATISPREVRNLGPVIYPDAATDTWRREVISPVSAVINNAHDLGEGPPIRIKGYSAQDRIDQDTRRGKLSRQERPAADGAWISAFCAAADPYNAALAAFMFETGARIGQATQLRPRDLDLQNARVRLPAAKGHPEQWVAISIEMVVTLANLPPRQPHDRKSDRRLPARVFGYATHTGPLKSWRSICTKARIAPLTPHEAGRHGFYTELRIRQGLDPVTVAKAGRWSGHHLPDTTYAHAEADERALREGIRTSLATREAAESDNTRIAARR